MQKRFLTPKEVEKIYGINRRTLANWRWAKKGPTYIKLGSRRVLYPVKALEEWIQSNAVSVKTTED